MVVCDEISWLSHENKFKGERKMDEQNKILEDANKWYGFWTKLPKIVFWVTVILFFIWGIVDPSVFVWGSRYYGRYYGVMQIDTWFGAFIIWQLIGWASALLDYVVLKLVLAPMILQVECLKEIKENTKKENNN